MKILLAGGAGYIGSVLVPALLGRGYEVDVIDLLWFGNRLPEGTQVTYGDVLALREQDLEPYEQVIFLAGLSNDPMAEFSPADNFVSNAATPSYLAYAAKRAGVRRFIFGSSCSVYGYTLNELYDETAPAASQYPYGISKLQGEFGALEHQDDKYSVISLRKGTVSGYSPRMRFDLVVNTMFKTAMVDRVIRVNNPSIWRPILAIQDAVTAYVRAVEAAYEISGVFNVASANYTLGEIGDYVRNAVEARFSKPVRLQIDHKSDLRNYKVDTTKAQTVLGFKPQYRVEDIVLELADHVHEFGDFSCPDYYNIEIFRQLAARDRAVRGGAAA